MNGKDEIIEKPEILAKMITLQKNWDFSISQNQCSWTCGSVHNLKWQFDGRNIRIRSPKTSYIALSTAAVGDYFLLVHDIFKH